MTKCNNTTTMAELPVCDSVNSDSYIIVEGVNGACKVKLADLVLGPDNSSFWPQIQQLINKVDEIATVVQNNSAGWNNTAQTVTQNKPTWDTIGDYNLTNINNRLTQGESKWDDVASVVNVNSSNWEATYQTVDSDKSKWNYAHDVILSSQENWNTAYTITLDGIGAIHEALELVNTSAWFKQYTNGLSNTNEPTFAQVTAIWSAHQLHEQQWNSVYNTVKTFSATW